MYKILVVFMLNLTFMNIAQATQFRWGSLQVVFNGIAALGLCISALMVWLGYRLMFLGAVNREGERGSLVVKLGTTEFSLVQAAPGVVFAGLGCIGMIVSLIGLKS